MVDEPMRKIRHVFRFENESGLHEWWLYGYNIRLTEKETDNLLELSNCDPIDISFLEPIGDTNNKELIEFVSLYNESMIDKNSYIGKRNVEICGYDPTGWVVERFMVYGLTVVKVKFKNEIIDGYDISKLDIDDIVLTVKFDIAGISY